MFSDWNVFVSLFHCNNQRKQTYIIVWNSWKIISKGTNGFTYWIRCLSGANKVKKLETMAWRRSILYTRSCLYGCEDCSKCNNDSLTLLSPILSWMGRHRWKTNTHTTGSSASWVLHLFIDFQLVFPSPTNAMS